MEILRDKRMVKSFIASLAINSLCVCCIGGSHVLSARNKPTQPPDAVSALHPVTVSMDARPATPLQTRPASHTHTQLARPQVPPSPPQDSQSTSVTKPRTVLNPPHATNNNQIASSSLLGNRHGGQSDQSRHDVEAEGEITNKQSPGAAGKSGVGSAGKPGPGLAGKPGKGLASKPAAFERSLAKEHSDVSGGHRDVMDKTPAGSHTAPGQEVKKAELGFRRHEQGNGPSTSNVETPKDSGTKYALAGNHSDKSSNEVETAGNIAAGSHPSKVPLAKSAGHNRLALASGRRHLQLPGDGKHGAPNNQRNAPIEPYIGEVYHGSSPINSRIAQPAASDPGNEPGTAVHALHLPKSNDITAPADIEPVAASVDPATHGIQAEQSGFAIVPTDIGSTSIFGSVPWGKPMSGNSQDPNVGKDGMGLMGSYYVGRDFEQFVFQRADSNINFIWTGSLPGPLMPPKQPFSVRWTGELVSSYTEPYTIMTGSDDGVRLYLNGNLIIDNWTVHAVTEDTATVNLVANQPNDITVEYFEKNGMSNEIIKLYWESAHTPLEYIPESALHYPISD